MTTAGRQGTRWARLLSGCAAGLVAGVPLFAAAGPVPDDEFLSRALDAYLSGAPAAPEEAWTLAAAPLVDFAAHPSVLGRLWVAEIARAGDGNLLQRAREEAAASAEAPVAALERIFREAARGQGQALVRAAARLYAAIEPEASPSRLRLLDLESGALDAAAPRAMSVRHRSFLAEDSIETLRVAWPEDGGFGAAVVRYTDGVLPPDVVFFGAGQARLLPLSGVARIDFLVAGSEAGGGDLRAPVYCERLASLPFEGLEARASADRDGTRLTWTTTGHDGMWGWVVFREELLSDGSLARTGPEIVPSSERAKESFRYAFVDRTAAAGAFYRYTVWAVTDEGLLARAFSVSAGPPQAVP